MSDLETKVAVLESRFSRIEADLAEIKSLLREANATRLLTVQNQEAIDRLAKVFEAAEARRAKLVEVVGERRTRLEVAVIAAFGGVVVVVADAIIKYALGQ